MNDEKHAPLFSIIVPVYNVEDYICECIESVLSQSIDDYELILVNDGSTDKSRKICEDYANKYDNVKLINKENGGLSSARNCGINNARGKFLIFLDSDDFWSSNNCLKTLEVVVQKPCDFVTFKALKYFDGRTVDDYGDYNVDIINDVSPKDVFLYMIKENKQLACAWNKVIKREYIVKNSIFFREGITGEDIDWTVRLYKHATKIYVTNDTVYMYRQNREGSITNTVSVRKLADLYNTIKCVSDEYKYCIDTFGNAVKSFMAFEYAILLYTYPACKSDISVSALKEYEWLFDYAIDKKTKCIKALYRLFGFKLFMFFIRLVGRIR